jgi:hypothetical protein
MKLTQIVTESADVIDEFYRFFEVNGDVSHDNHGIVVNGDAIIREKKQISALPFKISKVTGTFDMMNSGLTSLKNFPNEALKINVSSNIKLKSLVSDGPIRCNVFNANDTSVIDLDNCQLIIKDFLDLQECNQLRSVLGNNSHGVVCERINIIDCPEFQDDPVKINAKFNAVKITYEKKLPLLRFTLYPSTTIMLDTGVPRNLRQILLDYRWKGPAAMLDLMMAMRNAGFKDNARL